MSRPAADVGRILAKIFAAAPVATWFLFGAGLVNTAGSVGLVLLLWLASWSGPLAKERLALIGQVLLGLQGLNLLILVAFTMVRLKATGPGGISLELEGPTPPAPPKP